MVLILQNPKKPCERISVDEIIDKYVSEIAFISSIHRNFFEQEFANKTPTRSDYIDLQNTILEETKHLTDNIVRLEKLRLETAFKFPI